MTNLPRTFSLRLKQARKSAKLTQESLSKMAGYSQSHVRRIENASQGYNSQIQTVQDYAQALNVSPAYLLGLE